MSQSIPSTPILNIGDVVKLISNGPKMTINQLYILDGTIVQAECVWFLRSDLGGWSTLNRGIFGISALEKVVIKK